MTELEQAIAALASSSEAARIYAAEDIGFLNQSAGVPPLFERLELEGSRAVRVAIYTALGRIGGSAVIAGMIALLDHPDSFLRNQAAQGLRAQGARAVPLLEQAFLEGDHDRRKMVLDALAGLDSRFLLGIYRRALADPDLNIVITAVENLGNTRRSEFCGEIEALAAGESHPMLLAACVDALAEIGDSQSLELIRRRLADEPMPDFLRPGYLRLIGRAGRSEDVAEIAEFAQTCERDADWVGALTALRERHHKLTLPECLIVPLVRAVRRSRSPLEAYQAVRLVGGLIKSSVAASEFIDHCLDDAEKAIRIGAIEALRETGLADESAHLRRRQALEMDEEVLQILSLEKP